MLPAQFANHHHGSSRFIDQIAAVLNFCIYAKLELLGGDQVIDQRIVKEDHGVLRLPLPDRAFHGGSDICDRLASAHESCLRSFNQYLGAARATVVLR